MAPSRLRGAWWRECIRQRLFPGRPPLRIHFAEAFFILKGCFPIKEVLAQRQVTLFDVLEFLRLAPKAAVDLSYFSMLSF